MAQWRGEYDEKLEMLVLVARILMPILFITAGWGKITGWLRGYPTIYGSNGCPGFYAAASDSAGVGGGLAILFGF